jgi:hypothetical protein
MYFAFFICIYMYFSLAQRKVPKETLPGSLACGFPRANAFFGAGRNSLENRPYGMFSGSSTIFPCHIFTKIRRSNSLPAFPEKTALARRRCNGQGQLKDNSLLPVARLLFRRRRNANNR